MSIELSISCSQGRIAEWHDTVMQDGHRKGGLPWNADRALQYLNEHWYGDVLTTDAEKFNAVFESDVQEFNARQKRPCTKMGMESSKPERQKSYYEGIEDGTFCYGKGKQKENALYEAVIQIGNKDDNGITDANFDSDEYYRLKSEEGLDAASEYAKAHLNINETTERTKRILKRTGLRLLNLDKEHLIIHRIDFHGDEPCGTPAIHVCWSFRATDYQKGMVNRCAADRALDQMGIKKSVYKDKQISELHERFKNIVEEEMKSDAYEFGYEPIHRKAPTGEKKVHLPVEIYRDVVAQQQANAEKSEQQFLQQIVLEADKENFENEKRDAEISMMIEQAQNEYAMDSVFEIQQEEMKKEQERQQAELRKKENLVASQISANKTEAESLKLERKNIDADKKSVTEQKLDMNLKKQDLDTKIQNYKDGIERIQQFSVQLPEQQAPVDFIEFAKSFNRKVPVFEKDVLGNRQYKRNADGKIVTRDESCYESYCAVQKRHRDLQNQSEDFLEKEKQHGFGFVD